MVSRFSRWMQHRANARAITKIQSGNATMMGMELLVLQTVGRRTGRPRQTPVAWFPDGERRWLVVASGGSDHHPDWYLNLRAHPEAASVMLPHGAVVPVTPHQLDGAERERAWQAIVSAVPRFAKYQAKSGRPYPVVELVGADAADR
ncbi:nitroreductase/quinone reductase family protein [Xylanimonas sp. McL0601]|uniref:nitroreductase/quinone reductase family protein n=1 Tax=Xylanimonas sp. McL0601 TaxID=3414739 RepID=UPI003CEC7DD5